VQWEESNGRRMQPMPGMGIPVSEQGV